MCRRIDQELRAPAKAPRGFVPGVCREQAGPAPQKRDPRTLSFVSSPTQTSSIAEPIEERWSVCLRSEQQLSEVTTAAATAAGAAETVRRHHPGSVIVAVFALPLPSSGPISSMYSDLPPSYREVRAHRAPAGEPHGFAIVSTSCTGERSFIPGRPMSLDDAVWRRDWLLRSYFESLMKHRAGRPLAPKPVQPAIVRLAETITLTSDNSEETLR